MRFARKVFARPDTPHRIGDGCAEAVECLRAGEAEHTYPVQAAGVAEFAVSCERLRAVKANAPIQRRRVEFCCGEASYQEHGCSAKRAAPKLCRRSFGLTSLHTVESRCW